MQFPFFLDDKLDNAEPAKSYLAWQEGNVR